MSNVMKNTLKSVIALAIIAAVCVTLLSVANGLFPKPDTSAKLDNKTIALLQDICDSESYEILFGSDSEAVSEFNASSGSADTKNYVNAVYRATGSKNNGKIIVEAIGAGYSNGPITILVSYTDDRKIMGVAVKNVDTANTFYGSNLEDTGILDGILESLVGKSGNVGKGKDLMAGTGATYSLNGIASAVNLANEMISRLDEFTQQPAAA